MIKDKFLSVAIEAAKNAEKIIMKYYSDDLIWQKKSDQSPVTAADIRSEQVIIDTIKKYFPHHSFLGEEPGNDNIKSKYRWIIDPIDGTKNYTRQIPLFATQIALLEEGEIILGLSHAPAINEMIYAQKRKGAFLHGKTINVSKKSHLADAYLCYGNINYFYKHHHLDSLLKLSVQTYTSRGIGDFWP